MVILSPSGSSKARIAQIISVHPRHPQNKPRSGIGAGDSRSRDLHAEPYVQLHLSKNRRPAYSGPHFAGLAWFCFNWRRPSPKNLKSSCSSRQNSSLETSWGLDPKEEGILNPVASDRLLEGWSGAVVLVEYLALVYAHDPVESDYEEKSEDEYDDVGVGS